MSLIVHAEQGKLRGKETKNVLTGKPFYSFQGIPYVEPPLRFQVAETKQKWEGIYDATYERDHCMQLDIFASKISGSEDCLHLNIYTPQIPEIILETNNLKPVMVLIHGGGFFYKSSSEIFTAADFLIRHDVIIVTFNYRLNVFGFLNLGIPECTGNFGLKDQTMALRWINTNIEKFGGDPKNITLFGQSAGGVSVHYHTISPMSKGLFQKAIIESGSALSPFALVENPYEMAFKFGTKLGFKGEDKLGLLEFLKKQDLIVLLNTFFELQNEIKKLYPFGVFDIPFCPSVEAIKDGAFLPDMPEKLLKSADPIPIIYGEASKEGHFIYWIIRNEDIGLMEKDFSSVLKANFDIEPESEIPRIVEKTKNYYFGNKEISLNATHEISNFFSDIFSIDFYEAVENITNSRCPVYLYQFDYEGRLNLVLNRMQGIINRKLEGACHSDQIGYLFHRREDDSVPCINEDDLKVINEITTLWTNFAKSWKLPNEFGWRPSTETEPSFLRIAAETKVIKGNIFGERMQFLKDVLGPYAKPRRAHRLQ